MAVHEITLGKSGSGKSYALVHALVTQWLPFAHNGTYYTNLPLEVDEIIMFMMENYPEMHSQTLAAKIHLFDKVVTDAWMAEESGPWEYFADKDLEAGRIVIDEVHNYVHTGSSKEYVNRWRKWLGEIRHDKCTAEFVSQYETKVHPLIRHEAGVIRRVAATDDFRDKLFWVKWGDHFQLLSKLRGYYASRVWTTEFHEKDGKWSAEGGGSIALVPRIYKLYNSYSAPIAGGGKRTQKRISPHPYARMKWGELLRWYFSRNFARICFFSCIYLFLGWLFVGGGIADIFKRVTESVNAKKAQENDKKDTEKPEQAKPKTAPDKPAIVSALGTFDAHGKPFSEHHVYPPEPKLLPNPAGVGGVSDKRMQ